MHYAHGEADVKEIETKSGKFDFSVAKKPGMTSGRLCGGPAVGFYPRYPI
jgi:hypothetical protein